jgi:hypothetical protein
MNKYFSKIQVELNNTATDYEPYIELQIAQVNADGVVNGLTYLSPSMTLFPDNNVTLECEYNTDTKTSLLIGRLHNGCVTFTSGSHTLIHSRICKRR